MPSNSPSPSMGASSTGGGSVGSAGGGSAVGGGGGGSAQPSAAASGVGSGGGGMDELLPLVLQLTNPDQVGNIFFVGMGCMSKMSAHCIYYYNGDTIQEKPRAD